MLNCQKIQVYIIRNKLVFVKIFTNRIKKNIFLVIFTTLIIHKLDSVESFQIEYLLGLLSIFLQ